MDSVTYDTIQRWVDLCKFRRNAYWRMHYAFSRRNNYISIPLILIASSTGLTSVAQASVSSRILMWVTASTGSISAALAAMQRYFRYAERAEQCKSLAKNYGILAAKLETKQCTCTLQQRDAAELLEYADEIRKHMDDLMKQTDDAPIGYLTNDSDYMNLCTAVTQQQPSPRRRSASPFSPSPSPSPIHRIPIHQILRD